jgi:plastocyanin
MRRDAWTRVVAAALGAGAVLASACDGDGGEPKSRGIVLPEASPLAGGAQQRPPRQVVLVARAHQFDKAVLHVASGTVTIELDNRDVGRLHNLALFDGDRPAASPIAATALLQGPQAAALTFNAPPGLYYFSCQVHPEMNGTIRAS